MFNQTLYNEIKKGLKKFILSPFLFSLALGGHPICVDGLFGDWVEVPVAYSDNNGDAAEADFSIIKITYDSEFLFIYFRFNEGEFLMQDWNDFHLYLDSDNNSSTGKSFHGIGAELEWTFGARSGHQHLNGEQIEIYQNDLNLRIGPTITSQEFEIAISREAFPLTMNGSHSMTNGKIVVSEVFTGGDLLPDEIGGVSFSINEDDVFPPEPILLEKYSEDDIRILSYNTWGTGIIDDERQIHFKRVIQALDPDIIALQEHSEWEEIDGIIQAWFPNEQWHASWTHRDLVVLSRFSIINDASIISSNRTMVALLNTENELGKNLLVFNSHLSCCSNNEDRQQQVDEFASVWREWVLNSEGPFEIEEGTPFVHVGDFNYVGYRQQVVTIRDGDIEDENQYGNDFLPDWDSTSIIDLFPRHTHKRMGYTWRKDGSSFNPGKLDYVFYSDATIDTGKYYILNTLAMDDTSLSYYELEWEDTQNASDHLPIVFDIAINNEVGIEKEHILPNSATLYPNYPNPFNSKTSITFYLSDPEIIDLSIIDIMGNTIKKLIHEKRPAGNSTVNWDGKNMNGESVTSGIYFCLLNVKKKSFKSKIVLIK